MVAFRIPDGLPEAKLHKMDTFGALQQTHATNTRAQLRACTNETKRNDFGIGLTPHPPIYIYIYIYYMYTLNNLLDLASGVGRGVERRRLRSCSTMIVIP